MCKESSRLARLLRKRRCRIVNDTQSSRYVCHTTSGNVSAMSRSAELRAPQVAVFNGQSRSAEVHSLVAADESSGHDAAAAAAAAVHADVAERNDDDAKRDWMHRLRPGDIVLVSVRLRQRT